MEGGGSSPLWVAPTLRQEGLRYTQKLAQPEPRRGAQWAEVLSGFCLSYSSKFPPTSKRKVKLTLSSLSFFWSWFVTAAELKLEHTSTSSLKRESYRQTYVNHTQLYVRPSIPEVWNVTRGKIPVLTLV